MSAAAFDVDPREERLPKWAREQIARLRRIAVEEKGRADEARLATKAKDSDTIIKPYDDIPIGLGRGPLVRFVFDVGCLGSIDARVMDRKYLDLQSSRRIQVSPRASNHLMVEVCE